MLEGGAEPGDARHTGPGVYDPACSADVSPLLNGLGAPAAQASASADVDSVPLDLRLTAPLEQGLDRLARLCAETRDEDAVRSAFDRLSWELLRAALRSTPADALRAMARRAAPHRAGMTAQQLRIDQLVRARAGLWPAIRDARVRSG